MNLTLIARNNDHIVIIDAINPLPNIKAKQILEYLLYMY